MRDILRAGSGCARGEMHDLLCGTNAFTASQGGKSRRGTSVNDVGRGGLVAETEL